MTDSRMLTLACVGLVGAAFVIGLTVGVTRGRR